MTPLGSWRSGWCLSGPEILENGVRRSITAFSFVNLPIGSPLGPASGWPVQPDVLSNTGPEGRVYLIALDPVQPPELALRARAFLRRFLEEHFRPNDVAAVVLTGRGLVTNGQDFTSDPRRLLEAIDRFSGGGLGGSHRDTIRSLRDLTEVLARMPGGRKGLIYITRDPGFDAFEIVDRRPSLLALRFGFEDAHHVIATATRNNISFYPVDPAGLSPELEPLEMRMNMVALAEVTGGVALSNSNSFTAAFDRIVRENSTYYTLGFDSSYEPDDGR